MYIFFYFGKNIPLEDTGGICMRKKHKVSIFICFLVLLVASFMYGYFMMDKKISQKPDTDEISSVEHKENDRKKNMNMHDDMELIKEDDDCISPNTSVERRTYYKKCGHTVINVNKVDNNIINMQKNQLENYLKENYTNIRLVSFSAEKIVLYEEKNCLCMNHYVIGESQGKIAIYKIDENGERVLDRIFNDAPVSMLKEIDQEKIKEGIVVDSEDELSNVLENFIS